MLSRRRRPLVALGLACALLVAQWALAVYACPLERRAAATEAAAMRAAGRPCDDTDERQPALCHQHMAQEARCTETTKTPWPALTDVTPASVVPAMAVKHDARAAGRTPHAAAQAPPILPLYLATRRVRD